MPAGRLAAEAFRGAATACFAFAPRSIPFAGFFAATGFVLGFGFFNAVSFLQSPASSSCVRHLFNGIWSSIHCSASAARGKSTGCTRSFQRISHLAVSGLFQMV